MSFTYGKPWIATEKDTQTRWSCAKPGENFRCGMCGHKFVVGDRVRWQYTNDIPNAGGNPMICEACDGPDIVERWIAKCAEWSAIIDAPKWWKFHR
jgi:hypothetical protein